MPNLIALSVPFFFLLIAGELLWARRKGLRVYRLADAIGDLGCGVGQQLVLVMTGLWLLSAYTRLYEHRLLSLPSTWAQWAVALVGVDFAYYWWHRLSHRVSLLWAVHVVHHQSEDYNLAVALRQAIPSSFTSLPFYLPLALVGVPPLVYLAANGIDTLYQFWIHTELVGKLGRPVELALNTPSHHRAHHAVNRPYLDKNYGGILIVWDRLFGTFVEEREKPIYGLTKPFRSFDPVWAQIASFFELWDRARPLPRVLDKLKLLAMPPEWDPSRPSSAEEIRDRQKHESAAPVERRLYALAQFVPLVAATFVLMLEGREMRPSLRFAAVALLFLSLSAIGALLDGRRWAFRLEAARWGAVAMAGAAWAAGAFPS
jgi:alkylglycerol monooxygenase